MSDDIYRVSKGMPAEIHIHNIEQGQVDRYAPGVLEIMASAYQRYEQEGSLHWGAAIRHFDPANEASRAGQLRRMLSAMRRGSVYRLAYLSAEGGELRYGDAIASGVIKTTPSRPTAGSKLKRFIPGVEDNPNCYVGDIASVNQSRGLGSALLHSALSDYSPAGLVVADAIEGNGETFFANLGFKPEGRPEQPLKINGDRLPLVRLQAVIGDTLDALGERLQPVNLNKKTT